MRFIRHILSHLVLIILITGVATVYYFRNQVLPESYVQKIDLYAGKIHPGLVALVSPLPVVVEEEKAQPEEAVAEVLNENISSPEKVEETNVADDAEINKLAEEIETEQEANELVEITAAEPVMEPVVEIKEQAEVVSEKTIAMEEQPSEVVEAKTIEKQVAVEKTPEPVKNIVEPVASKDQEAADYKKILNEARMAYGKGDVKLSIKKYNELVELENHEADFYGELGNVYYATGNWDKAGASYYEAAIRLIDKGQIAQVDYLQKVIQGLDAERAGKLAIQLSKIKK